jgi:peptide/nickel transport system permease protein
MTAIISARPRAAALRQRVVRDPLLIGAIAVFAVVIAWSFWPSVFASGNPTAIDADAMLLPPSAEHPFGTDQVGRDQFTRVVYGTSLSMLATLVAVLVGLTMG